MAARLRFLIDAIYKGKGATDAAEKDIGQLGDTVKNAAIALGGLVAADKLKDMARLGATAERVEKRFESFAEGAGGATAVLDAFQRGAGGAASQMQAMESASKLLQMGLVGNAAEMEQTVEMATRLGDQTASVGDRVADFAALLANQSIPRLDNFGIASGKVRKRVEALSATMSRDEAFKLAVMEEGAKSLQVLGDRTEDNLASFERMEAKVQDMTVAFGKALAPAIVLVVDALTGALNAITPFLEEAAEATKIIKGVKKESDDLSTSLKDFSEAEAEGADVATEFADRIETVAEKTSGLNDIILWLGHNSELLGRTASRADLLADVTDGLHQAAARASDTYADYLAIIDRYNSQVDDAALKTHAWSQRLFEVQANAGLATYELRRQNAVWEESADTQEEVGRVTEEQALATLEAISQVEERLERKEKAEQRATEAAYAHQIAMAEEALAAGGMGAVIGISESAWRAETVAKRESAAALEEWRVKAEESREAMDRHKQAIAESAGEYATLAGNLKDATDQQIANTLIGMLDPEEMGAQAFTTAVTEIGTAFGTMDATSIALAENLPILAQALEDNVVPAENADEALAALASDAADGDVNIGNLIGKFDRFPDSAEPSTASAGDLALALEDVRGAGEPTITTAESLAQAVQSNVGPMSDATQRANSLEGALNTLAGDYVVRVRYETVGSPPSGPPAFQFGGVVPGPIGKPQLAVVHGGERISNPYQAGALGGPGGPTTNNYGGNTVHNHFYNKETAAWWRDQQRRGRYEAYNTRVRGR